MPCEIKGWGGYVGTTGTDRERERERTGSVKTVEI
jgi:hypothetical protein